MNMMHGVLASLSKSGSVLLLRWVSTRVAKLMLFVLNEYIHSSQLVLWQPLCRMGYSTLMGRLVIRPVSSSPPPPSRPSSSLFCPSNISHWLRVEMNQKQSTGGFSSLFDNYIRYCLLFAFLFRPSFSSTKRCRERQHRRTTDGGLFL